MATENVNLNYDNFSKSISKLKDLGGASAEIAREIDDEVHAGVHRFNHMPCQCTACGSFQRATESIEMAAGCWL